MPREYYGAVPGPQTQEKMAKALAYREQGRTREEMQTKGSPYYVASKTSVDAWIKKFPEFRSAWLDARRVPALEDLPQGEKMDFISFRSFVLGRHTFEHMKQWAAWLSDESNDHILILCPPETAKTTVVLDYILYQIYLDPDVRIGYASRTLPHSIKQVSKVKNILEQNALMRRLCGNLVPGPGDPHPWRDGYFTVATRSWTPGEDESDYTLAAYGSGSQITGSRFNFLVFDDPDDVHVSQTDRETIWDVILQSGESRLGVDGRMVVIGNRQGEEDVYRRILDQWEEDAELWNVYTQSAVDPATKATIWPEKFGLPKKRFKGKVTPDGPWTHERAWQFFDLKHRRLGSRFNLIYQNNPQADRERDFSREMMDRAKAPAVKWGQVPAGSTLICALDPAPTGPAAVLVYALLPPDKWGRRKRRVVDFEWGENWRHQGTVERILRYGMKYRPQFWVIERSATSRFLVDDPFVTNIIQNEQKAYLYTVTTGAGKHDHDYGVAATRNLFVAEPPLIEIPGATSGDWEYSEDLRRQFIDYVPDTTRPHDGPMCVWFAERCIREFRLDRRDISTAGDNRMRAWKSPYSTWGGGSWSLGKPVLQSSGRSSQVIDDILRGSR